MSRDQRGDALEKRDLVAAADPRARIVVTEGAERLPAGSAERDPAVRGELLAGRMSVDPSVVLRVVDGERLMAQPDDRAVRRAHLDLGAEAEGRVFPVVDVDAAEQGRCESIRPRVPESRAGVQVPERGMQAVGLEVGREARDRGLEALLPTRCSDGLKKGA